MGIYLSTDQTTRATLFFGIWDPESQLYQPIYQGFDRYPKRFLDPSPIYLSTDQKTRTTLFFGIRDPSSISLSTKDLTDTPIDSWILVLSTYLPTKKHALPFFWGSGIRDPSSINLSTKDLTDTPKDSWIPVLSTYLPTTTD